MNYLRLFDAHSSYNIAKGNFVYPNVSYCIQEDEVHFMRPPSPYTYEYLTFEAIENCTFRIIKTNGFDTTYMTSVSYSTDNGTTWNTTQITSSAQTINIPTITAGNKVLFKGIGVSVMGVNQQYIAIEQTNGGRFNVSGNIMSFLYGDDFANHNEFSSDKNQNLSNFFQDMTHLVSAENLILPVTTLTESCYRSMFNGCTSLTTAPKLPATTLRVNCYYEMFYGCTSLTTPPELPATTLARSCYKLMFQNCTALTTAPELPATILESSCYELMFQNCTALTTAPELPATTLKSGCYDQMFKGCSRLNKITAMFTTTPSSSYTYNWVSGVAATGTFIKNSAANWNVTGVHGVPSGWTIETASA